MFAFLTVLISVVLAVALLSLTLSPLGSTWQAERLTVAAAGVTNQGQQYRAGLLLYAEEHAGGAPVSLDELVPGYLIELPTPPGEAYYTTTAIALYSDWLVAVDARVGVWMRNLVSRATCDAINLSVGYINTGIPRFVDPTRQVQCLQDAQFVADRMAATPDVVDRFTALFLVTPNAAANCAALAGVGVFCRPPECSQGVNCPQLPAAPSETSTCPTGTTYVAPDNEYFVGTCRIDRQRHLQGAATGASVPPTLAPPQAPSGCTPLWPTARLGSQATGTACFALPANTSAANLQAVTLTAAAAAAAEFSYVSHSCSSGGLCSVYFRFAPTANVPNAAQYGDQLLKTALVTAQFNHGAAEVTDVAQATVLPSPTGYLVVQGTSDGSAGFYVTSSLEPTATLSYQANCPDGVRSLDGEVFAGRVVTSTYEYAAGGGESLYGGPLCLPAVATDVPSTVELRAVQDGSTGYGVAGASPFAATLPDYAGRALYAWAVRAAGLDYVVYALAATDGRHAVGVSPGTTLPTSAGGVSLPAVRCRPTGCPSGWPQHTPPAYTPVLWPVGSDWRAPPTWLVTPTAVTPSIGSVSPGIGLASGGYVLTITGTGLDTTVAVSVCARNAAVLTQNATTVTATVPAGTALTRCDVTVHTSTGGQATATRVFQYVDEAPVLTGLSVTEGPVAGDTRLVLAGEALSTASRVTVCTAEARITARSSTSLTVYTPAHAAGDCPVTVTASGGSATAADSFTYVGSALFAAALSPALGAVTGGTTVLVTGSGMDHVNVVTVCGDSATAVVATANTVHFTSPPHLAGTCPVTLSDPHGGLVSNLSFTYGVPAVTSYTPTEYPVDGSAVALELTGQLLTGVGSYGINGSGSYPVSSNPAGTLITIPVLPALATLGVQSGDSFTLEFWNTAHDTVLFTLLFSAL